MSSSGARFSRNASARRSNHPMPMAGICVRSLVSKRSRSPRGPLFRSVAHGALEQNAHAIWASTRWFAVGAFRICAVKFRNFAMAQASRRNKTGNRRRRSHAWRAPPRNRNSSNSVSIAESRCSRTVISQQEAGRRTQSIYVAGLSIWRDAALRV